MEFPRDEQGNLILIPVDVIREQGWSDAEIEEYREAMRLEAVRHSQHAEQLKALAVWRSGLQQRGQWESVRSLPFKESMDLFYRWYAANYQLGPRLASSEGAA